VAAPGTESSATINPEESESTTTMISTTERRKFLGKRSIGRIMGNEDFGVDLDGWSEDGDSEGENIPGSVRMRPVTVRRS